MTKTTKNTDSTIRFRDALAELETITKALETDDIDLDSALEHFERGSELVAKLESELRMAELRIEQIKAKLDSDTPTDT
ncbi:exodeoxyribonuclease VII small subunit [Candidatus Saccharibacteria bacterium]|nr:exodeoxyribonuclease VII small subunit [Candidatus Saccharibacteria bacterium]